MIVGENVELVAEGKTVRSSCGGPTQRAAITIKAAPAGSSEKTRLLYKLQQGLLLAAGSTELGSVSIEYHSLEVQERCSNSDLLVYLGWELLTPPADGRLLV